MEHINMINNKIHMIISTASEKVFDTIQHPYMTKVLKTVGIKGMYLIILQNSI
jgi:hypothetical protein